MIKSLAYFVSILIGFGAIFWFIYIKPPKAIGFIPADALNLPASCSIISEKITWPSEPQRDGVRRYVYFAKIQSNHENGWNDLIRNNLLEEDRFEYIPFGFEFFGLSNKLDDQKNAKIIASKKSFRPVSFAVLQVHQNVGYFLVNGFSKPYQK